MNNVIKTNMNGENKNESKKNFMWYDYVMCAIVLITLIGCITGIVALSNEMLLAISKLVVGICSATYVIMYYIFYRKK